MILSIKDKHAFVLFAFFLVMLTCMTVSYVIANKATSRIAGNAIYMIPSSSHMDGFLTWEQCEMLRLELGDYSIDYEAECDLLLENGVHSVYSPIIYASSQYAQLNYLMFSDGSFWPGTYDDRQVIVLSEALAWKLFGNVKAVGLVLKTGGAAYEVVGVYRPDHDAPEDLAFIPIESSLASKEIERLCVVTDRYSPVEAISVLSGKLEQMDKSSWQYTALDVQKGLNSMTDRTYVMLLFSLISGCICSFIPIIRWIRHSMNGKGAFVVMPLLCVSGLALLFMFFNLFISGAMMNALNFTLYPQGLASSILSGNLLSLAKYRNLSDANMIIFLIVMAAGILYASVIETLKRSQYSGYHQRQSATVGEVYESINGL